MADPFLAEIRIFPFDFAPLHWAFCSGQILPISQNAALFSLLGTNYGGDGRTNFALPDLRGRTPMAPNSADPVHDLGEIGGSTGVTLTLAEIPAHSHNVAVGVQESDVSTPSATTSIGRSKGPNPFVAGSPAPTYAPMSPATISPYAGGGAAHNNMMPYLAVNFCIALAGIFPQRG